MIKTLIKLKILKFILIGGVSAAYAFKKYCDQKNEVKEKKIKNLWLSLDKNFCIRCYSYFILIYKLNYNYYINKSCRLLM